MKFNEWSLERIQKGTKRLTSRRTAHYDDPSVSYIEGPLTWGFIRDFLYRDEGAESPEELQRVINRIFRRVVKDHELFFVHVLKQTDPTPSAASTEGGRSASQEASTEP